MTGTPYPFPREIRQTEVLNGTGVATYGPFAFRIFDEVDVKAFVKSDGAELFEETPVTVTKTSGEPFDTFTVTFSEPVPPETRFVVQAARVHERQAAITKGGAISTDQLEKELSKQGTVIEELRRDVNRALKPQFGDEAGFPGWEAGKPLTWDPVARRLVNGPGPEEGRFLGWQNGRLVNRDLAALPEVPTGAAGLEILAAETPADAFPHAVPDDAVGREKISDKIKSSIGYNVMEYSAVGDGLANDRAAFEAAHAAVPAGYPIVVPAGTYDFGGSDLATSGRRWVFNGNVSFPNGELTSTIIERNNADGSKSFGSTEVNQYSARYRFGRNAGGISGFQIGGADPNDGIEGLIAFNDGYSGWTTWQPSQYPSAAEMAIQPSSSAGKCNLGSGTNVVSRVSGGNFAEAWVGSRIYIEDGRYLIASVDEGAQTLTVTNLNGSAVTFSGETDRVFVIANVRGAGICDVNGTNVTRVTGDPFPPTSNTEYKFEIGGTVYDVSTVTDINNLILSTSAGTQSAVAYRFWTSIDDLTCAFRVQRLSGAGFEEVLSFAAYGSGKFHIHAGSGATTQRPLHLGSGFETSGEERTNILLDGVGGNTLLGGGYDRYSLRVGHRDGNTGNALFINGADSGGAVTIATEGVDTDIDLALAPKNAGKIKFNASIAGTITPNRVLVCKDDTGGVIYIPYAYAP